MKALTLIWVGFLEVRFELETWNLVRKYTRKYM